MEWGYLLLETGEVFAGRRFGAAGEVVAELVFTTAMTGYLETLTDPSYYGQMVVQTFPLIGNYGVIPQDFESKKAHPRAYIVREWCQHPSNFRSEGGLDAFLKAQNIAGLCDVDTREITKHVRERGVMNAMLSDTPELTPEKLARMKRYRVQDAVAAVGGEYAVPPEFAQAKRRVVLWDFGAKQNICRELTKRGCSVAVLPPTATAQEILALKPDGIMLSNGPGDPAENAEIIAQLSTLCTAGIPTFGICLGHQLLALAQGARTEKLKYGHRGANQPARDTETGRVYITSQNHGYAVIADSLPPHARLRFVNANDQTCEGVDYLNFPAFSVQFHPEAAAGPLDTSFLFDRFIEMISKVDRRKDNAAE